MRQLLAFLPVLLWVQPAQAQAPDSLRLHPGDLIRLAGPLPEDEAWVSGTVIGVDPHSFTFRLTDSPSRTYSREFLTVDTIDVAYHDSRESARGGGILGGFVGASLGLVAGAFLAPHISMDTGTSMALAGAGGGILGGLAGALTAATISPRRWHRYVFQGESPSTESPPPPAGRYDPPSGTPVP